jgi:hypothetical protein
MTRTTAETTTTIPQSHSCEFIHHLELAGASCRPQFALLGNQYVPHVQILDLIFEIAALTMRQEPGDFVDANRRGPIRGDWPIIHTLSDAKFVS